MGYGRLTFIADFGLWSSDCSLFNPQSAFRNSQWKEGVKELVGMVGAT